MGLSTKSACPHAMSGLIPPSSFQCPLAFSVGIINATSLRLTKRPPQPTGPLLRPGCVVPAILATTTRSASLDDSHRLPSVAGYTVGLCPTTWSGLSPRPSPLWVNAPSLRAIIPTPGGEAATPQVHHCFQGFPHQHSASAPPRPQHPFSVRDLLTTLQGSLDATARRIASPPGRV
jgi:hypothetical protein